MIFWKRRKHNLPKFPEEIIPLFDRLATELKGEQLIAFKNEVGQIVEEELKNSIEMSAENKRILFELINLTNFLLEQYEERTPHERKLIIGAIKYFVGQDDPIPDQIFQTGLLDDAKVMNYVLEELGIEDRYIELRN